jgi:predicted ferric reductase
MVTQEQTRLPIGTVRPKGSAVALLQSAAIGSVLVVVLLWIHNGNLTGLASGTGAWTSAGRLAGLVAADLLLIQVLLMARIPAVERSVGQDRIARWHRYVGFTSINLVLLHVLLITVGYAATDRTGLLAEAWNLITTYPGMLLAAAASVALIMVAVTSVRAARRRLRYESWHLLHLYAYLGVGLALPHQLWTGQDFVLTAPARAYWWTLYVATAGSVLIFRLGVPVIRSLRHNLRVAAVVPEGPGVTSIYLSGRHLDRMPVQAGQFFIWRFLHGPGFMRGHPYSLSAAPRHDRLRLTVKDLGDGSRIVRRLRPGTRVLIEGPYGRLTGAARLRHRITMIASGIGITPIRALLEAEYYRPGEAVLLYRVSTPEDATFRHEIDAIAHARGVRVIYLPGRRGGATWLPDGYGDPALALYHMVPDVAHSDVFVCGPEPWMDAVVDSLNRLAVPRTHVHLERFAW